MARIRTVLKDIRPEELGFTYPHEHLICHPPKWVIENDPDLELPDVEKATEELKYFYNARGRALVEGTAINYGRQPEELKYIAMQVPVHIIATTGFVEGPYYPDWVRDKTIEGLADLFVKEINEEIDKTGIKVGQIKVGASYNFITEQENKIVRAAGKAQRATGTPIFVHTENGTMGLEVLEILRGERADLSKVAIGHTDRNPDYFYHLAILKTGAFIEFDSIGKIKYHPESVTIDLIKNVIGHGYIDQLLISGDMGRKSYLKSYGGGPGFEYIISKFAQRLIAENFSEKVVQKIFIENPSNWLQF
jgi:phosphotriesterase-related protein